MFNHIKYLVKKLLNTGFFSIYLGTICSKVIILLGGVFIVRLLSQEDYGIYTLVLNAISMLCIFGDLGAADAVLQYGIKAENDKEKQKGFLKLGLRMMMYASIASIALIILSPIYYPYQSKDVERLAIILCAIPLLKNVINYMAMILRVKRQNNQYSLYQLLNTAIHYGVIIILTILFGLKGSIVAQYVYNIIIFIIGLIFVRKYIKLKNTSKIDNKEKKDFWKMGISYQLNNTLNSLLYQIDIFILGIMSNNVEVSIYKVATIIPNALVFLPQCLGVYVNPYFISNNTDPDWIKQKSKKIIKYMFPIYLLITIILIVGARFIFNILYGEEYLEAILPFSLLMIGFLFSAGIKTFLINIIYCMHRIWFGVILNVISMIINVILDVILTLLFGYIGVAIATLIVNIITAIISYIYFKKCINDLKKKNEMETQSIN